MIQTAQQIIGKNAYRFKLALGNLQKRTPELWIMLISKQVPLFLAYRKSVDVNQFQHYAIIRYHQFVPEEANYESNGSTSQGSLEIRQIT